MRPLRLLKKRILYASKYRKYSKINFPEKIEISTNSVCNARCRICPYPETYKSLPRDDIGDDLFKKIIDESSNYPVKRISPFLFNDPFTDSKIISRIKYIIEKMPNTSIVIHTNGGLLTEERSKQLIPMLRKVDSVNFSFHGGITEESYKIEMGIDLNRTIKNITNFVNLSKGRDFEILINNRTLKDMNEFKKFQEFWSNLGVDPKNINPGELVTRAKNVKDTKVGVHVLHKKLYGCAWDRPLDSFHIISNGDVVLCCMDWRTEVILGNVKENSIYDIWNGEKYKNMRKMIYGKMPVKDPNFICNRCEIAN